MKLRISTYLDKLKFSISLYGNTSVSNAGEPSIQGAVILLRLF
jgi:hypothetical protein